LSDEPDESDIDRPIDAGKELFETAELRMAQQAIKRPDRIEAVLLPGVWDPH